ncbi:interleukin-17 receptor B isoform X6 [Phycodurus eques]|uniref:interleukin-17 receptor B isoform X6 n=1 Tax=Phycodurus eques TaxID=693459 RepID=UPI002ACDA67C|nr:interleukin-17 receptor B isoform X6 [Phycodurus eques]
MGKLQLFVCIYLSALVTSQAINVKCQENYDFPPTSDRSPSLLADLKLDLVKVSGKDMMNVSWAIDIDGLAPKPKPKPKPKPTRFPTAKITDITTANPITDPKDAFNRILVKVYLGLAAAMILTSGYIIYKRCGTNSSSSAGLKSLATSAEVPVRVLLVYPPENGAFQKATMALAEFLQSHAGCSVAIDVWQQNRIAHVGPMRWLAEQVEAARRVLVVCPPSCHPPPITVSASTGGTNIPAAAHDLYPLILNMVASHAKSARELAKFWVLQLGEQQDKRCNNLAPELRACELFCLMKDLSKLCHTLHTHEQNAKTRSTPVFGPGIIDDRTSVLKLRDSVEKLSGCCLLISREAAAVNSVIISV